MRILVKFLFLLLLVSSPALHAAFEGGSAFSLHQAPGSVPPDHEEEVRRFLAQAQAMLPDALKTRIGRPIQVRFKKLSDHAEFQPTCDGQSDSRPERAGYVARSFLIAGNYDEVVLNRSFLAELKKGESASRPIPCRHGSVYRFALATLIHELSHIYDFTDPKTPADLREIDSCDLTEQRSPRCDRLRRISGYVSDHAPFTILGDDLVHSSRGPDAYEREGRQESFAVNMEFFLLDPEYACRRPALQQFLADHFRHDPFPARPCAPNSQLYLYSSGKAVDLDPARVYQIHFLLAARGKPLMSRWGHAMFRLVVCAPHRPASGPECLQDVENHVVVGFRAASTEARYDYFKGLTGKYPSRIQVYPLDEVVREYAAEELRDLVSLPLKLSDPEKRSFLSHVLEIFWGYDGKYLFLTKNCAWSALRLLQAALPGGHPLQEEEAVTPMGVYQAIVRSRAGDEEPLRDREAARIQSYIFESKRRKLETALTHLQGYPGFAFGSLAKYLEITSAPTRRESFERLRSSHPQAAKKLAAAFLLLESRILFLEQERITERISEAMSLPEYASDVQLFRQESSRLGAPALVRTPRSYGVPLREETFSEAEVLERWESAHARSSRLMDQVLDRNAGILQEYDRTRFNIDAFRVVLTGF